GMEEDANGMPSSLAINRGPGTAVAAAMFSGAGSDLPQGNAAEQGYMGNHATQSSGESNNAYGYGAAGAAGAAAAAAAGGVASAAAVRRHNTNSSASSGALSRDNSGAGAGGRGGVRNERSPRRGPSNASSAYSGSAARNSEISNDGVGVGNGGYDPASRVSMSAYAAEAAPQTGYAQYTTTTELPANLHHQQPNPYGHAVDLHIPGAGGYSHQPPARAQSGAYEEYDYNDAYRGSQIYGTRNNAGGPSINF
ncbi:hypothetical protein KEM52_001496, partial [Ascosphaera acerosa]